MFNIGQKVVCINVCERPGTTWREDIPVKGTIYTIEAFDHDEEFGLGLILLEIKNSSLWNYSFVARRFRPVVERSTDISIFTEMLIPASKHTEPAL
jgi:hypothetical protein